MEKIDPVLKEEAETTNDMFFKQKSFEKPICMDELSEEELHAVLEKGYADILAGRTKPAKEAFAKMRENFNLKNK